MLPKSSRNQDIYTSCLEVVDAIWKGEDEKYERIFQTKSSNGTGSRLAADLRKYKAEVEQRQKSSVSRRKQFKLRWQLDIEAEKVQLIFTEFSRKVPEDEFKELLGLKREENLQRFYHLFVGEAYVTRFERRGDHFWADEDPEAANWDGEPVKPNIFFLSDDEEHEYPLTSSLTADYPDLEQPTLWTPGGDDHL